MFSIKTPFLIASHGLKRAGTGAVSKSAASPFGFNTSNSNKFWWKEGSTLRYGVSEDATQTLTNKTLASPTLTGTMFSGDTKFCTTQFDAVTGTTGATLTDVVGLTGFSLAAAGVYSFEVNISGVSTANSGIKLGFGYTTLTATSIESLAAGFTASAVAVQHTTTSTTGMTLFGQTAAVIGVRITGRLIVNAAGTLAVQAAQNAAHADTTSVYVGSFARFSRIS